MSRHPQELPQALVFEWGSDKIRAQCPYCRSLHRYGLQSGRKLEVKGALWTGSCTKVETGRDYHLIFQQADDSVTSGYGWQLDRDRCRFVTTNAEGPVTISKKDYKDGRLLLPQYAAAHQLRSTTKDHEDTDGLAAALNGLSIETTAAQVPHGPAFFHRMPTGKVAVYRLETSARPRKPTGECAVYRLQTLLEPPAGPKGLRKAFATLDRGSNYPCIMAMSGYSHAGWPEVLDNVVWTHKAENLRACLGLPKDKSAASHVEPQLLAYLLDHHSLHRTRNKRIRQDLTGAMPAYDLQPIITVSKRHLRRDCDEFFELFKIRFPRFNNVGFRCVGESITGPSKLRA